MRLLLLVLPATLLAGAAAAQGDGRGSPLDPRAKAPPVEYRSAFEGYRPYRDQELRDWRKANEEVGAAGGRKDHGAGGGASSRSAPPRSGEPESSGARQGRGGHK